MRVFSVDGMSWTPNGSDKVSTEVLRMSERLTTDWQADDIAEFDARDRAEIVWKKWHSCRYTYQRLVDVAYGIDIVRIQPGIAPGTKIWVSDHPMGFIAPMRNQVHHLFSDQTNNEGALHFVRPGKPAPASFYRIPLFGGRATIHTLPSHGQT